MIYCPNCESDEIEVLKSRVESSKTHDIEKLVLQCKQCNHIFKKTIKEENAIPVRVIISANEDSEKTMIELYPDVTLKKGDTLETEKGKVEVKSLENKDNARLEKAVVKDIATIWTTSLEIPVRIGVSIDFRGWIQAYKIDVSRKSQFEVGDVLKLEDNIFVINSMKTEERKMRKGFAKAPVLKRIYGKPVQTKKYDKNLTKNIVQKKEFDKRKANR